MSNAFDNNGHGSSSAKQEHPASDGISMKLREFYRQLEQEDIPTNLLMLLDKLDQAEKASAAAAKAKADD
jgi:Anti-sigma factor NepR